MPISDRAAQFSSFAALTGYNDVIDEVKRDTDEKTEYDEYVKSEINSVLKYIIDNIKDEPSAAVTYFVPDEKKTGGKYVTKKVCFKKYNGYENTFETKDGTIIKTDDIYNIETD